MAGSCSSVCLHSSRSTVDILHARVEGPTTAMHAPSFSFSQTVHAASCMSFTHSLGSETLRSMLRAKLPCSRTDRHEVTKVMCMANPRRVQMVAQQIKREIGDMLIKDDVLKAAVVPEHALGADRFLSSIASVTDVEVSSDLQVAKVYISVFGDERGQNIAIEGLKAKARYVRGGLGKRMRLRFTPEVRFLKDDSLERGSKVLGILDKIQAEREAREPGEVVRFVAIDDDEEEEELGIAKPKQRRRKASTKVDGGNREMNKSSRRRRSDDSDGDFELDEDEKIIFLQ